MNTGTNASASASECRLRFDPVVDGFSALEFPCDADGHVDLDALDEAQRHAYFCARMLRALHHPPRVICAATEH